MAKGKAEAETMARPILLIRVPTRERIGGTTFLRYAYGKALAEGRACDAGDFDRRGQVFRSYFEERVPAATFYGSGMRSGGWKTCIIPTSAETVHLKADLSVCVAGVMRTQRSLVLDFSGSEGAVMEYARDNSLSDVCAEAGVSLTAVAMVGPGAQDIATVMRLVRSRLFEPAELLLVCNAGLLGEGEDALDAFAKFLPPEDGEEDRRDDDIRALAERGARTLVMPRFPYAAEVEDARVDFFAAADPSCPALGIVQRVNTRVWLHGNVKGDRVVKAGMAQMVAASRCAAALP